MSDIKPIRRHMVIDSSWRSPMCEMLLPPRRSLAGFGQHQQHAELKDSLLDLREVR